MVYNPQWLTVFIDSNVLFIVNDYGECSNHLYHAQPLCLLMVDYGASINNNHQSFISYSHLAIHEPITVIIKLFSPWAMITMVISPFITVMLTDARVESAGVPCLGSDTSPSINETQMAAPETHGWHSGPSGQSLVTCSWWFFCYHQFLNNHFQSLIWLLLITIHLSSSIT